MEIAEKYQCPEELRSSRLIVLDIETTGLSIIFNNIIELGVVEVVDGEVKTEYSRLFGGGRSSIYLARRLHGIRDVDREGKSTFLQSAQKISEWLSGAILVTHNGAKFDIPFIERKMKEANVPFAYSRHIDTCQIAQRMKKDENFERTTLEWLCHHFEIEYGHDNHRGLRDCECTLQLLYALCQKYETKEIIGG